VYPTGSERGLGARGKEIVDDVEDDEDDPASPFAAVGVSFRDLGRMVKRNGPLPAVRAVQAVRKAARALLAGQAAGHFAASPTHVLWLGSVLFFALTGRAPLEAPRGRRADPRCAAMPPAPSTVAPYPVHPALDVLVQKCLAERASDRFASLAELATALTALPFAEELVETPARPPHGEASAPSSAPSSSGIFRREDVEAQAPGLRLVHSSSVKSAAAPRLTLAR